MGGSEQLTLLAEPTPEIQVGDIALDARVDHSELKAGRITAALTDAKSILTPASGFMAEWDYTLNPYAGCGFGCNYCYAAFFARDPLLRDTWGDWVKAKQNAVSLLHKLARRKPLRDKSIYMSSVTDAYQPVERKLKLSRSILRELVGHQPRLAIQTRSPLVTRDIDLLREFHVVQVNMTITTDSEAVRRAFEPHCPTNAKRLAAITEVTEAGLDTGITLTPLLPVEDAEKLAAQLLDTGVQRFVVQPFHVGKGRFVRGTRKSAIELAQSMGWDDNCYTQVIELLRSALPSLEEGRAGFAPPE